LKRLLAPLFAAAAAMAAMCGTAAAQNTNNPQDPSGPQTRGGRSDWELEQERRNGNLGDVALPAYPKTDGLIEFWVSNSTAFRFFIDAASLSVGADNVVRYTLVARSASGIANVSYEGMRCAEGTYRIYAYGHDGRWSAAAPDWRPIEPNAIQRWHNELRFRYFCASRRGALLSREEGLDALRRGGHPGAAARPGY
jgi:hypothetical protein